MIERMFEFVANHWLLVSAFFGLLTALMLLEGRRAGKKLSPQQAVMLVNRDAAVLVDLRDRKEFSEGHIAGSLHIPQSGLKEAAAQLKQHADKQILLIDKMGQHAALAVKLLRDLGIVNVARLDGGIAEWRNSNLPLVKASGGAAAGKSKSNGKNTAARKKGEGMATPSREEVRRARNKLASQASEAVANEDLAPAQDDVGTLPEGVSGAADEKEKP